MMPSTVAKKIPKSEQHARRRIKNKFPVLFVANVINEGRYGETLRNLKRNSGVEYSACLILV